MLQSISGVILLLEHSTTALDAIMTNQLTNPKQNIITKPDYHSWIHKKNCEPTLTSSNEEPANNKLQEETSIIKNFNHLAKKYDLDKNNKDTFNQAPEMIQKEVLKVWNPKGDPKHHRRRFQSFLKSRIQHRITDETSVSSTSQKQMKTY